MRITRIAGVVAALAVTLGACAGNDNSPNGSGGKGSITVASANFPESQIVGSMYAKVLRDAGYKVNEKPALGSREVYLKAMKQGEVDVIPEYIGTLTEYVNTQINGPNASFDHPLATGEADKTFANLQPLLQKYGGDLQVTSFAKNATDQNSFAVTKDTAQKYGLTKMSDLAKPNVAGKLVLGAGGDCEKRPFCFEGLTKTYGATFKESGGKYKKFENPGDANTLKALKDGTIGIGLVFTSDGSVDDAGLVRLEDDKKLQPSDNVCALVRKGKVDSKGLALIDKVNQSLTTDDLKTLNKKFNVDKEDAAQIAEDYLKGKSLI